MKPNIVVDIGNSRMKWGLVRDGAVTEWVSLSLTNEGEWAKQLDTWILPDCGRWAVASVNPEIQAWFRDWITERGAVEFLALNDYRILSIRVALPHPEQVGMDRLLNALAAYKLFAPKPCMILSLGTAITVDLIDEHGVYHGGAIMPGLRMMAQSLHEHTAKLPLIEAPTIMGNVAPGKTTEAAIRLGIASATLGGINAIVCQLTSMIRTMPRYVITGGDAGLLTDSKGKTWTPSDGNTSFVPTLTLEGIRIAAEALP